MNLVEVTQAAERVGLTIRGHYDESGSTPQELYAFANEIERVVCEECAKIAQSTICDTHIPTGINIYGTRAAKAIRSKA